MKKVDIKKIIREEIKNLKENYNPYDEIKNSMAESVDDLFTDIKAGFVADFDDSELEKFIDSAFMDKFKMNKNQFIKTLTDIAIEVSETYTQK